jgi:hypothetical protein
VPQERAARSLPDPLTPTTLVIARCITDSCRCVVDVGGFPASARMLKAQISVQGLQQRRLVLHSGAAGVDPHDIESTPARTRPRKVRAARQPTGTSSKLVRARRVSSVLAPYNSSDAGFAAPRANRAGSSSPTAIANARPSHISSASS